MLTLRQALALPCFEAAQVVAGAQGLDKVVRRVHVVDIPDATYTWGRGGLLLTAGYGLKDSPERQAALIPKLQQQGLVGLVFSTGWYFETVPEAIRAAAEARGFPVITVPREVEFIAITERLYAEIVNEQFAVKERADAIHRQLMRLVLEGGDLGALAATLAGILERSVLIDSASFEVLAVAQHGPVDESRQRTAAAGYTPPEILERLASRGVYAELQRQLRPVRVRAMPDIGMHMERVVAPIVVEREIIGYLWIVAGDRPLTDLDELAIDNAATIAALILLKEQAVRQAQQAVRGDLLAELLRLDGEPDSGLRERAHLVGYQLERTHQALFVARAEEAPGLSAGDSAPLAGQVERWLASAGEWGLVVARQHGVALIVEAKANAAGQALGQRLASALGNLPRPVVAGVGRVHTGSAGLRRSFEEAVEAAEIAQRLCLAGRACCFWELGLMDWLYLLPPDALRRNAYVDKIRQLAEHDARSNGALVNTLEAYLDHGGALAEAAAVLSVHRNTLLYRLGRIEAIADLDLKDVGQRVNAYVALKGYRLKGP